MGVLQRIMDEQRSFQDHVRSSLPVEWGSRGPVVELIDNCDALVDEALEMKHEFPWKKWRAEYGRPLTTAEIGRARIEWVDCLHFLVNAANLLGIDEESAWALYEEKHGIVVARQKAV